MASRTESAEKPQRRRGMIERREMAGEAEKMGKYAKGAQRAQLRAKGSGEAKSRESRRVIAQSSRGNLWGHLEIK